MNKVVFTVYKSYIVAAGAGDLLPTAIESFGEILVHGVDIKHGKTFVLGMVQGNVLNKKWEILNPKHRGLCPRPRKPRKGLILNNFKIQNPKRKGCFEF